MSKVYDVIILGGGLVGASLAALLAESQLKILLIDAKIPPQHFNQKKIDARVFAITRGVQRVLQQCQVWESIAAMRISPYQQMKVWDATGDGRITFSCCDIGEADLGHIIENQVLLTALYQRLQHANNIDCCFETNSQEMIRDEEQVTLNTDQGKFSSRLLIGADGANSWLRQQGEFKTREWDYQHHALVATIQCEKSHQKTAWQRFMPKGPLALLPLSDPHLCSIVWSSAPNHIAQLQNLSDEDFNLAITHDFANQLGEIKVISSRHVFPLRMRHANHYCQERVVLIGDAAHTLHPLAGQGANLGVLDANVLANTILNCYPKDIGRLAYLRRFERERKSHNVQMIAAMEGFKRLFTNDITLLKILRNFGLNAVDSVSPLKNYFMRQAMGLDLTI